MLIYVVTMPSAGVLYRRRSGAKFKMVIRIFARNCVWTKWKSFSHPANSLLLLNGNQRRCSSLTNCAAVTESSSDSLPVSIAQSYLESVHALSHLPWWCTIVVTCVGLRAAITLPLAIYQNKLVTKIELLQPTLKELGEALKHRVTVEGRQVGLSAQAANREYKKKLRKYTYDLYRTNGCNPIKLYTLPWMQIPLWIVLSLALRNLSGALTWDSKNSNVVAPHADMSTEGALWFPDLTAPDPTGVLPVFLGLANLANIELHAMKRKNQTTKQRAITMMLRSVSLFMIVIAYKVPAAMSLYWAASAGFGLLQNVILKFPRVRRFLGIPKTPSENARPFREMASIVAGRARDFVNIQREDLKKHK